MLPASIRIICRPSETGKIEESFKQPKQTTKIVLLY